MRQLTALLVLVLALSGCSACAHLGPVALPGIPLDVDPSLALIAQNGSGGHACPVVNQVLTARHVTWDPLLRDHVGVTWSSRGQNGYARVYGASPWEDLVSLALIGGTVTYLPNGVTPQPGDAVYWFEYDFRTQANAYRARRRVAEVIRSVARHLLFDAAPTPGASGTCLFNASGEVVGVVIASDAMDDQKAVGVAVQLDPDLFQ